MHCIKNRWGFGFYLLRLLHSLSVGTLIGTPRVQSRRFISYSWLDFIYEGPGTQLAAKLSWSTFLETTALFSCVLYLSLETGLNSTSGLKVPSEQGSLLCSVLRVVRFQWNQKLLKAACYDFFFLGICIGSLLHAAVLLIILKLILTLVLISALLAKFARSIRLSQTRAKVEELVWLKSTHFLGWENFLIALVTCTALFLLC